MGTRATAGTRLVTLVKMGAVLLKAAWLGHRRFRSRATYFWRYRKAHKLYRAAIGLQAEKATAEGVTNPKDVAVDKSLTKAPGPPWHQRDRRRGRTPAGVDRDGTWGYSKHHGWVYGYSFEVVVSSTPQTAPPQPRVPSPESPAPGSQPRVPSPEFPARDYRVTLTEAPTTAAEEEAECRGRWTADRGAATAVGMGGHLVVVRESEETAPVVQPTKAALPRSRPAVAAGQCCQTGRRRPSCSKWPTASRLPSED